MTMDDNLLEKMKEESTKKDPMVPRTVRLTPDVDAEIHEFAEKNGLDFSVVVRAIMILGWEEFTNR